MLGPARAEEATSNFITGKIQEWSTQHPGGQMTVEQPTSFLQLQVKIPGSHQQGHSSSVI